MSGWALAYKFTHISRDAQVGAAIRLMEQGEDVNNMCDELMRNVLHIAAGAGKG